LVYAASKDCPNIRCLLIMSIPILPAPGLSELNTDSIKTDRKFATQRGYPKTSTKNMITDFTFRAYKIA